MREERGEESGGGERRVWVGSWSGGGVWGVVEWIGGGEYGSEVG